MTLFYHHLPSPSPIQTNETHYQQQQQQQQPPEGKQKEIMSTTPPSPLPPLRIAVLECDSPIGHTKEKYGGYGNMFEELLLKGVEKVRKQQGDGKSGGEVPDLDVRKFNVVDEEVYPDLEGVDAVLVSGSRECLVYISPLSYLFWSFLRWMIRSPFTLLYFVPFEFYVHHR